MAVCMAVEERKSVKEEEEEEEEGRRERERERERGRESLVAVLCERENKYDMVIDSRH